MIRISLALVLTLVSFGASSAPFSHDSYWMEVQQMTQKNHRPLMEYERARMYLMQELYLKKDADGFYVDDVYCGHRYRKNVGPNKMPNHNQLNVEHTWPQSRFNKRKNKSYQKSDLHHLFPSDSKANGKRGNIPFAEFKSGRAALVDCTMSRYGTIDGTAQNGFEPPASHKGNVARALFYFSLRYDIRIRDYEEMVLRQWNLLDPVDSDELKRNDMIEAIQGNRNPFVDEPELADLISNF